MTRVGAIDCGTHSIRLLVADVDPATGRLVDVVRRMEIVRLGEGVDRTGRIGEQGMARTLAMTAEYARTCSDLGVDRVRFVALDRRGDIVVEFEQFLDQVRLAIEALRALVPVLAGTVPPDLVRDFERVTANLQLAYAAAVAPAL